LKLSLAHFMLLSAFLLLFNSGKWGVIETSEARYAEISKEMFENHDFIHPKLLDVNHFHKPPLTYYITVLGYKIFGINAFGARFFLQMAILMQLFLIYKITLLLCNDKAIALTAVLIYFSLPLVLISSRNLTTDAYLNTFVLSSVYFWLYYKIKHHKPIFLYLFYLSLGLIFETKGPVGLLFPLFFIIAYKINFKVKIEKNIHLIFAFILFLIVSFAWILALIINDHDVLSYFINHQLKDRMFSNSYNRGKPFWYYFVTIPLLGLPWVIIILVHLITNVAKIFNKKNILLVLYITIQAIIVVFSLFHTKLILYVLPMFGFIAILMAKILSDASKTSLHIYNKILIWLGVTFLITLLAVNVFDVGYKFSLTLALTLSILTTIGYILISKYQSGYLKTAMLSYLLGCVLLVSGTIILIENEDQLHSTRHAINYINNDLSNTQNILVYNYLLPSAKFYSDKKNIITLNNGHNTVDRDTQFETNLKWKNNLFDLKTEKGIQQTDSILKHESVLISRKKDKLPDYLDFLNYSPYHKKEFGKWVIYY